MADETYVRKAQTRLSDGTFVERDWSAGERYQLYMRGFRDGAAIKAMRDDHIGLGAYDRGYGDGRHALHVALDAYGKEVGHVPSVLRTADSGGVDR